MIRMAIAVLLIFRAMWKNCKTDRSEAECREPKSRKIKLFALYDLLRKQTDEDHALSTGWIIELLGAKGIDVSRKVLPNDIARRNDFGYEVFVKKGHPNGYYVVDLSFDLVEVRMFSDVIQASKLTEGHKTRLV